MNGDAIGLYLKQRRAEVSRPSTPTVSAVIKGPTTAGERQPQTGIKEGEARPLLVLRWRFILYLMVVRKRNSSQQKAGDATAFVRPFGGALSRGSEPSCGFKTLSMTCPLFMEGELQTSVVPCLFCHVAILPNAVRVITLTAKDERNASQKVFSFCLQTLAYYY